MQISTKLAAAAAAAMIVAAPSVLSARQQDSAALAKELVAELTKAKTDCVFARDRDNQGVYAAALNVPGVQLFVVTAKFQDATSMEYRSYSKDCMGAYADINAAAAATDRIIIEDIGADGLVAIPKKDAPKDKITRDGKVTGFDGNPKVLKQQKVAPEEFQSRFNAAEESYTKMLRLLLAELKK